jgi:hypothetical protein
MAVPLKRLYWFNSLNSVVDKVAMRKLQNSEEVAWGTAASTKPVTSA